MAPDLPPPEPVPPEPSTYSARLSYAISLLKLLPLHRRRPALAEAIGMTPEGLYTILKDRSGKRTLTAVNNARAAKFCKVDPTWLATGEGSPRPRELSADALDVAELYDSLEAGERKRFWLLLEVAQSPAVEGDSGRPPVPPPAPGTQPHFSKARENHE